jgi:hypothetical protein
MAESVQTLGDWSDMLQAASTNRMVLDGEQLARHWRRVSLTADFWAQYLTLYVAAKVSNERLKQDDVHGILSYLLNELFENCAKFSSSAIKKIQFESWQLDDQIILQITNHIRPEGQSSFVEFLHTMLDGDPSELYFQRIEENAETGHSGSGLGYLTLIMDYGIRFGFRFRPVNEESVAIDIQAHVNLLK